MKNRALLFSLLFLSYEYYSLRTSIIARSEPIARATFQPPHIRHQLIPHSSAYVQHDYLEAGSNFYLGKYKWCDSLRIPDDLLKNEDRPEDVVYDFIWKGRGNDFKTDGFQVVPDYDTEIFYGINCCGKKVFETYYPVYVVNETTEPRYFIRRLDHVYAVQEAEDPYAVKPDEWWPIEYNRVELSREGWRAIKVQPGEFVLFMVLKYGGTEETRMRIRLYNGDNIMMSRTFKGRFHYNQFLARPESPLHTVIEKNDIGFIHFMFLGGFPKETLPGTDRWWRS